VPFIARWPGAIRAGGETDEPITIMDLLPTLVTLAGGTVPSDRVIDGKDIWPVIAGADGATSLHKAVYYLRGRSVAGVRMGDWKYLVTSDKENSPEVEIELSEEEKKLPRKQRNALIKERTKAAQGKQGDIEMLFNLRDDIGEQSNLSAKHPDIVARLKKQMEDFRGEFRKTTRPAGIARPMEPMTTE
jgi:arylsulfatase A-like enzyme